MKRCIPIILCVILCLTGCKSGQAFSIFQNAKKQYEVSYLELFDTVTVIKGYEASQEKFTEKTAVMHDELEAWHQLFDIYHSYDGVNNLKTLNDSAGKEAVEVSQELIDILLFGKEIYAESGGKVNIFMGSVLELWHEAREASVNDPENACLPDAELLKEASLHTDPDQVIIDTEKKTVFLADAKQRIDAGAIGKGYAAQKVMQQMPEGYILNLGGNICAGGPKPDGSSWTVGIQDPDSDAYLEKLSISKGSVVTSGDYQRYFICEGKKYHHIIDPDTLMPAEKWRSVTIIAEDSGIADFLSTALFLMDRTEGQALLSSYKAQAYWIGADGKKEMTDGFLCVTNR